MSTQGVTVVPPRSQTVAEMKVSDYVAQFLVANGVDTAFVVTGGAAMHLNDSLSYCEGLNCIFMHHEQSATMAAEGYARVTERPALVNVTAGPGVVNALNGVFGAFTDSIPMIVISGQVKRETLLSLNPVPGLRQMGDQEVDAQRIVSGIAKYVALVTDPQQIRLELEKALHLATSGRKGPVWLDIPIDVQASKVRPAELLGYAPDPTTLAKGATLRGLSGRALDRIVAAERPAIMVGSGLRRSGALERFRSVAKVLGIPVTTAWTAIDAVASNDPVYCGRPGTIGDRAGNFTVQNADVLLVIGSRLNIRQISYNWKSFAKNAFKVIVDIDDAELRKPMVIPDLAINADAADFIEALEALLKERNYARSKKHEAWLNWCKERLDRYPVVSDRQRQITSERINPYYFVDRVFSNLRADDVVVCANGSACVIGFQAGQVQEGQNIFANSGSASMGYDLPASIGAAVARRGERVVCLAGDGSVQMNIQELQTIAHHRLAIKVFILNNDGYVSCRITQGNFFKRLAGERPTNGVSFPDYVKVAGAFGIPAYRAEGPNFEAVIEKVLAADGPALCEAMLDPSQAFEPKLSARQLPDGRIVSPELEDLAPFLPPEELRENLFFEPSQ